MMSSAPNSVQFIPANFPNCGGDIRAPESREVVKCTCCGHDVIIHAQNKLEVEIIIDVV
jgi:hypothetical protein